MSRSDLISSAILFIAAGLFGIGIYLYLIPPPERSPSAGGFQVDTGSTLTTNLLAYYKEEDETDIFGEHDATAVNGPLVYGSGKIGNAIHLNGSGQAQKVLSDPFNFEYTQAFSVSFWFKMNATNQHYFLFNKKKDTSPSAGWNFTYYGKGPRWEFFMANASQQMYRDMTWSSPDTNWHHGLFTYDGSGSPSGVHFYIDNSELTGSDTGSIDSSITGGKIDFHIGTNLNDGAPSGQYFNGQLDEIGIWTKVLSSQERSDLWNSGVGNTYD